MKLNQKILNAINEGIRKSLLSFDDVEFGQSTNINQKVQKTIKDMQWIQENFVDLGLPSGTLWCKYNLGATCGDTPESWYGHYYMWGSTKPNDNDECNWKNAPFNNNNKNCDIKYILEHMHNFIYVDQLYSTYDAAYQFDNKTHMPTPQQIQELCSLQNKWINDYNGIKGLNGRLFIGNNQETLFIPAAGYKNSKKLDCVGAYCDLWSNSIDLSNIVLSHSLYFRQSFQPSLSSNTRCYGLSVRMVI